MIMNGVIFEGPDAAGKSTLARKVHIATGRPLYIAGGAPKDNEQMWQMIADQTKALKAGNIVDRVSCISQQIYRDGLWMDTQLQEMLNSYVRSGAIIVYCRPPMNVLMDPNKHEWKPYDTEEWKNNILTRQATFVDRYDRLMAQTKCIIYDWTSEESTHLEELLKDIDTTGVMDGLRDMMR